MTVSVFLLPLGNPLPTGVLGQVAAAQIPLLGAGLAWLP